MDYERIHEPLPRQSAGFSPAKLRAMLRGLEKHQRNGDDTSPEANDSGELDDRRSLECSTSTEVSSNSGNRSRNRAPEDDSFDSEGSSSGPPTVKRSAVAALLPPFSRPTPSKWDDAEKWISSPTSNRTGRVGAAAGTVPKKSALAFPEHGGRPPVVAKVVAEVPINTAALAKNSDGLTQPDLYKPAQSASIIDEPAPAVRSVSMRDMGTEMTPIASQEPSRTGTPIIASSPTSSRTPTPQRTIEFSINKTDPNKKEMSEEELQMSTRQEIMDLGQRLGKTTIAAWASKEEKAAANSMNTTADNAVDMDREARAVDWQEAEKAKYIASAKCKWAKIERKKAREQDRLATKLAEVSHRAEAKREAAEVRRNQEAARTEEQAAQIPKTGHTPSSFSCWCWCL
ncbi:hypothetical protein EJB05_08232 [Eragrostis curvula]|uniref:Remorin C-terminal domain-containing protein n=1 Tax=Eragrostis curvula TaxID=38414 RepID=A0A5J9WKH8_9POAL|nr:hypothetical protein EJB05_08232 [Eragrostis curvula]